MRIVLIFLLTIICHIITTYAAALDIIADSINEHKDGVKKVPINIEHYNFHKLDNKDNQGDNKFNISSNIGNRKPSLNELIEKAYKIAMLGQLEAALVLYKEAYNIQPKHPEVLYSIGSIYHKLNLLAKAEEYYQLALTYDPTHRMGLANYLAVLSARNPKYALEEMLRLEEINPNFAPILAQIAFIYAQNDNFQQAESYLLRAVRLEPKELYYLYNLAALYDQYHLNRKAYELYYEVIQLSRLYNLLPPVDTEKIQLRLTYLMQIKG